MLVCEQSMLSDSKYYSRSYVTFLDIDVNIDSP